MSEAAEKRDSKFLLRVGAWAAHLTGAAGVGWFTFVSPSTAPGGFPLQVVTYASACLGLAAWMSADLPRTSGLARLALPYSLGLIVVAGCLGATAGGNGSILIALSAIALLTSASELGLLTAVTTAVGGILVVEVGGFLFDQGIGTLLGFPLLLFVEVLVGRYRATYRVQAEQARALLDQHERLRAEQRRADVLDERSRIAREIHDVLAHSLGALGIQIQAARAVLTDYGDIDRALETLATAQRMASDGLTEARRAVHALRTDTRPLHEELTAAAEEHAALHRVDVHCEIIGEPRPLPAEATVALLRTARESLVNAAKHAPARPIDIDLQYGEHGIRMTIANDVPGSADAASQDGGAPVPQTINGGYGLTGMRERLKLLRGTLDAGVRGKRWIVAADLPLETPRSSTVGSTRNPQEDTA